MKKVLVIGDPMVDVWWVGYEGGQSAEVHIPVVKTTEIIYQSGGAVNLLVNLRAMGVDAVFGYSGNELDLDYVPKKNRLVMDGKQIARWDEDDACQPLPVVAGHWDAIAVADYAKGSITPELIKALDSDAWFIDSKRNPSWWTDQIAPSRITFFPNTKEYLQFPGVYDSMPNVVVKMGKHGIHFTHHGFVEHFVPATARKVVSVCGAGDTVMAAYTMASLRGDPPSACLTVAAYAGGLACEKPYTSVVELEELEDVLTRNCA